ncbi:MAG: alpha/beta hydrolase [Flavobacteriales bacterium]|nr:alpha/beta hydrolase [Flavobacteriales bacterium]
MKTESFQTKTSDGVTLRGKLFIPEKPKAIVQFNCGTAAKKEFYQPFLEYLSHNGYLCCLWDYRDSGTSAPSTLKDCAYKFSDYGLLDMPAIKTFLEKQYPDLPLLLFGHSAGGQQVGLMPNLKGYKGMVGFAVSTGYLPHMPLGYKLQSFYFLNIFSPISKLFYGYVAAKRFGIMEDLPWPVLKEWRSWCGKPNYLFHPQFYGNTIPEGHYKNMPFPIHIFWATDDPISNERSVPGFWNNVKSSFNISFEKISPEEIQVKSIGHFGFFKKKMKDKLWPKGLKKLDELLTSPVEVNI